MRDLVLAGKVGPDPKGWARLRRQEETAEEVPGVEDREPQEPAWARELG